MQTITVTHNDKPVAVASATRIWLAAHIDALPAEHPRKRFVVFMACYAGDVLNGAFPGPYTDLDAERFARLVLIDRDIIARHPNATDAQLAQLLGVPLGQLQAFLHEEDADEPARAPRCGGRRRSSSPTPQHP